MNILNISDIFAVSGGQTERLTVTTKISLNGFSDNCINTLANLAPSLCPNITEEAQKNILIGILQNCTFAEIELLDDRSDDAQFVTVSYN